MDKDIQDLFKQKNREILITNLKFDLDKNIDSLMETVTNYLNLELDTAITKISAVLEDASINNVKDYVSKLISSMKKDNIEALCGYIKDKKELLVDSVDMLEFTEDGMKKYYDIVFASTNDLKEDIDKEFKSVIDINNKKLEEYINSNINDENKELTLIRIKEYLENRLYGKLETKIHMEIMLRDNNLINKAKEVYLRYQDICSKTE